MSWGTKHKPKKCGRYLVTYRGQVRQADRIKNHYNDGYSWNILPNTGNAVESEVTAWMKEPKPYVEKLRKKLRVRE